MIDKSVILSGLRDQMDQNGSRRQKDKRSLMIYL